MVLAADGVVLRYGQFYGPGTYHPTSCTAALASTSTAPHSALSQRSAPPSGIVTIVDD